MSRFFSEKYSELEAYVPGEQPKDKTYIKLNTNESPFPPAPEVVAAVAKEAGTLNLYSDPESLELTKAVAERYGLLKDQVVMTNGSDEILYLAFLSFCDENTPIVFPDITYGFYEVLSNLLKIPFEKIPLKDDFTIDYKDYCGINKNIVFANPNAPTGIALPLFEVEEIVKSNPNNIVIVDEAYIDFAKPGTSAVELINKYDNLLVTMTFSKSRSLAGARIGMGLGSRDLILDLNTIRNSFTPYNISKLNSISATYAIKNDEYYMNNCETIKQNREYFVKGLLELGFDVLPSETNFVFTKAKFMKGEYVYEELKREGILVRFFGTERLKSFVRITIGTKEQMDKVLETLLKIKNKE